MLAQEEGRKQGLEETPDCGPTASELPSTSKQKATSTSPTHSAVKSSDFSRDGPQHLRRREGRISDGRQNVVDGVTEKAVERKCVCVCL